MVERCSRCEVGGDEVRLFDAIYEGRMGSICERCSIIENIPIIKKPDADQLRESEKGAGVYDRMKMLTGFKDEKKDETFFREDKLKELDVNPELEVPEESKLNLIKHYHWDIMKNRRRKGLSQKQLAETLGESEVAIQMIEKGKLPENAEILVRKLEQFFQTRLRHLTMEEILTRKEEEKPVLLDRSGRELEIIPEPEVEKIIEEVEEEEIEEEDEEEIKIDEAEIEEVGRALEIVEEPAERKFEEFDDYREKLICERVDAEKEGRLLEKEVEETKKRDEEERIEKIEKKIEESKDFEIKRVDFDKVKISDLRTLHRKRIEATKQEKIEEQKRIEEKQRLIEARKEELRLMKEKESEDLDKYLGGTELLGKKKEDFEEFDEELD